MNATALVYLLVAGVLFTAWPFVMRASGLPPLIAAFVLHVSSLFVFIPGMLRAGADLRTLLTVGVLLGVLAGVMNGLGHLAFQQMIALKSVELSRMTLVLVAIQIIVGIVGGKFAYGEALTAEKIIGAILILGGIALVTRPQ